MVCVTGQIDDGLVVHGSTLSLRWPGYPNDNTETVWMGALLMLVLLIFVRMISTSRAVCKIMMV